MQLLEFLVGLLINLILLFLCYPSFIQFNQKMQILQERSLLENHLNFSRYMALKLGMKLSFCPTIDGKTCHSKWENGYLIKTEKGRILAQHILSKKVSLNFSRTKMLDFSQNGVLNNSHGYFTLKAGKWAYQVIISRYGHVRSCYL